MDSNPDLDQVMELIMAGRTRDLGCPFCKKDTLESKNTPYGLRLVCPSCKKYIDAPTNEF